MNALVVIFGILVLLSPIVLIVGLIKPNLILIWSKTPTRLKLVGWWFLIVFLLSVALGHFNEIAESIKTPEDKSKKSEIQINSKNVVDYAIEKWTFNIEQYGQYVNDSLVKPPKGAKFIFYNAKKGVFESHWKWRREKRYAKKSEELSVIAVYWILTKKVGEVVEYDKKTNNRKKVFDAEEDYIKIDLVDIESWKCFETFYSYSIERSRLQNHKIKLFKPTDGSLMTINKILQYYDQSFPTAESETVK